MKSNMTKRFHFKRLTHVKGKVKLWRASWDRSSSNSTYPLQKRTYSFAKHFAVHESYTEKKHHCLKKRVCSQGSGPKFVWVRDVASISIRFTRNRSCTGSHRKKQLNRGNVLACECRRISGCRFSPPKNNVCEPEPQSHFRDLPPDAR